MFLMTRFAFTRVCLRFWWIKALVANLHISHVFLEASDRSRFGGIALPARSLLVVADVVTVTG